MLTLVDAISLSGDRAKQNDDACFWGPRRAGVVDGATDLHDRPLSGQASDAAWLAQMVVGAATQEADALGMLEKARAAAASAWAGFAGAAQAPAWMSPTAALLIATDLGEALELVGLGDCVGFCLDADGVALRFGGPPADKLHEQKLAAAHHAQGGSRLRSPEALELLRAGRATHNRDGGYTIFGLQPQGAAAARRQIAAVKRPAWVLLATDGLSALTEIYEAYDVVGLMLAARASGLSAIAQELRSIETEDPEGAMHPRWKRSDDATGLLLRLD